MNLEEAPERREGQEPGVGQVEDAAASVVELAEQEHQAKRSKGDVAGAYDQFCARGVCERALQHVEERFRGREVLDHVEREDVVEVGRLDRQERVVQVVLEERVELDAVGYARHEMGRVGPSVSLSRAAIFVSLAV